MSLYNSSILSHKPESTVCLLVSEKSSAVYVDKAVQQNEMLEIEKAKKIAKQTVKVKVTGTSDILQSKLLEMKLGKNEKSASFSQEEVNKVCQPLLVVSEIARLVFHLRPFCSKRNTLYLRKKYWFICKSGKAH